MALADILSNLQEYPTDEPVEVSAGDFDEGTLEALPEDASLHLIENGWPELYVTRKGSKVACEISEHIYTKYWWHKYHARVFCEAMVRAVRRLIAEGAPLEPAVLDDSDEVHLFVHWNVVCDASMPARDVVRQAKDAFDLVWERANRILDDSDSVLVLGKDTGEYLKRLEAIAARLQDAGFHVYIIKQEPDRLGESVLQKVLRYALASRFVIIENTEPSGHLYEIPHVAKMAECVVAVMQERGMGSTWMFEDGYFRHNHWRKFEYDEATLGSATEDAAKWAMEFVQKFGAHQLATLPWFKRM